MASTLSPSAVHRIIFLVTTGKKKGPPRRDPRSLQQVNKTWKAVRELYISDKPAPPVDYLNSLELRLVLKDHVDDDDVRGIFAHGKPLEFWGCPPLIVSKIVKAFTALRKEPTYLDVTITALSFTGARGLADPLFDGVGARWPSEAWSEVYKSHLPCSACTKVEKVEERRHLRNSSHSIPSSAGPAKAFAVEKFHVSSEHFGKQLTVELHCELEQQTPRTEREQSSVFHTITIRLTDETCSAQGRLSGIANRSSATLLLLPDFASEVFGFLERAHVGSSLLANRDLRDLVCQLRHRLPVHRLACAFYKEFMGPNHGFYWLAVRHRQRDLSYTDVRRFKVPSTAGAEGDCTMIRHYLSNSHVVDPRVPQYDDFPFTIKMLASLATRNFSVGRIEH